MKKFLQQESVFILNNNTKYLNKMVKHIVAFKLTGTDEERREVALKFKEALLALPEQIEVLRSMEVGINENPNETWDVVLTAVVDTMADVEVYAKHPAHVAAASLLAGHKGDRACVDYEF
jgi:hypothetical protein